MLAFIVTFTVGPLVESEKECVAQLRDTMTNGAKHLTLQECIDIILCIHLSLLYMQHQ